MNVDGLMQADVESLIFSSIEDFYLKFGTDCFCSHMNIVLQKDIF